jgi:hypothetical protein
MKKILPILLIVNISLILKAQPGEESTIFPTHQLFYDQQTDTLWGHTESLTTFLKIYADYENARTKLASRDRQFLDAYSSDFLSDIAADSLSKKWLKNDISLCKLRKCYFKKLSKASSSSIASKYVLFGTPIYPSTKQHVKSETY